MIRKSRVSPIVIFVTAFALHSQILWASERIDFVFDIDDVLVTAVDAEKTSEIRKEKLIDVQGVSYRITDGAGEFIESLLQIPGAHISFFSANSQKRNRELLSKLKLPGGRNALDAASSVLSVKDLTTKWDFSANAFQEETGEVMGHSDPDLESKLPEFRNSHNVKKDLRRIQGINLDRAIFFEDVRANAYQGQERNLLEIPTGYSRWEQPSFDENIVPQLIERSGQGGVEFFQSRNRLMWARGFVDWVIEQAQKEGMTVADALFKAQWLKKADAYDVWVVKHPGLRDLELEFYRRGAAHLKQSNPSFRVTTVINPSVYPICWPILQILRNSTK